MNRFAVYSALLAVLAAMPAGAAPPPGAKITDDGWFAPAKTRPVLGDKITRTVVIPIHKDIVSQTHHSLRKKLEYCLKHKAQLVILDMDVSRGNDSAALDISRMLKTDMRDLRVICYVRTRALWGGLFVAMACDESVMTPVGMFGVGGTWPSESVARADLGESAERAGRHTALAEKLASADIEVWLIRNKKTRELRYVQAQEWQEPIEIPAGITTGVSNDQADWILLRVMARKGETLALRPTQAAEFGLIDHIVDFTAEAPYANLLKLYNVTGKPLILNTEKLPPTPFAAAPASQPTTKLVSSDGAVSKPGAPRHRARPRPSDADAGGYFAEITPNRKLPSLPAKITQAYILTMRASEDEVEPISGTTYKALRRKAIRCRASGAQLIIIDMHTWGGGVIAALDIARLIKHDLSDIYVVCYVRTRAVSAGALIALACDEIVMTPTGKIGDCAPIVMGGKLEGVEREKIETVLREEFAESAKRNGYSVALAESLVSTKREVWKIRNKRTGELQYVLKKDYGGKVFFAPGKIKDVQSNPNAEWELVDVTVSEGELLTMKPQKAVTLGIVSTLIDAPRGDPYANILKEFNVVAPPIVLADTWSEILVGWLTSPGFASLLMLLGIMGIYVEIRTPGLGLPGLLALICFAILFGSQYLIGMAAWWEIALFVLGVVLIGLEVFVIPGFGVAGISGIICCVIGLLVMFVDNPPGEWPIPQGELGWDLFAKGLFAMACAFVGSIALSVALARYFRKIPFANRLCLALAAPAEPQAPVTEHSPVRHIQVGDRGVVESMCRPVGKVRFGEDLVDAVSEGEPIDAGMPVRVLAMDSNRPIVTKDPEA